MACGWAQLHVSESAGSDTVFLVSSPKMLMLLAWEPRRRSTALGEPRDAVWSRGHSGRAERRKSLLCPDTTVLMQNGARTHDRVRMSCAQVQSTLATQKFIK